MNTEDIIREKITPRGDGNFKLPYWLYLHFKGK